MAKARDMPSKRITATVWVRGPDDINWRTNAMFHRPDFGSAIERASQETAWYAARGYRVFVGPEAPELDVPE